MNFFDYNSAAERYAKGRPYFHPLVIERIPRVTQTTRFESAIDVCCGTGMSTRALKAVSDAVVGTDLSHEMIRFAPKEEGISYCCCPAEEKRKPNEEARIIMRWVLTQWLESSAHCNKSKIL